MTSQAINKLYGRGWLVAQAKEFAVQKRLGPKSAAELAAAEKGAWEKMSDKGFTNPLGYQPKKLDAELEKRQASVIEKFDKCPRCANQVLAACGDYRSCACGWNSKQVADAVKPVEVKPEAQDEPRGLNQFVMAKLDLG